MKFAVMADWQWVSTDKKWKIVIHGKELEIESLIKQDGHYYRASGQGVDRIDFDPEERLDEVKASALETFCNYHHFTLLEGTSG